MSKEKITELKKEIESLKAQLKLATGLNNAYSIIIKHNNNTPIYPYFPSYPIVSYDGTTCGYKTCTTTDVNPKNNMTYTGLKVVNE